MRIRRIRHIGSCGRLVHFHLSRRTFTFVFLLSVFQTSDHGGVVAVSAAVAAREIVLCAERRSRNTGQQVRTATNFRPAAD